MRLVLAALLALAALPMLVAPSAQGACVPHDETQTISGWRTLVAGGVGYYVWVGTTPQADYVKTWREANEIPGLQTSLSSSCGAPLDHHIVDGCASTSVRMGSDPVPTCPSATPHNAF